MQQLGAVGGGGSGGGSEHQGDDTVQKHFGGGLFLSWSWAAQGLPRRGSWSENVLGWQEKCGRGGTGSSGKAERELGLQAG